MAGTTIKVSEDMLREVKSRCATHSAKAFNPGLLVSMAVDLWVNDLWNPGPDPEGLKSESLYLQLNDDSYIDSLVKRRITGVTLSQVARRALQDWLDGKWDIGLVRN